MEALNQEAGEHWLMRDHSTDIVARLDWSCALPFNATLAKTAAARWGV
jgi:hypothetical protein